jgi:uncharacterized CHY-type Zn-finger protein
MVDCEECRKQLRVFEGYRHPALGTRFLVCGRCYDKVERDMKRWSEFCVSDSFNTESTKHDIQDAWNIKISNDPILQHWFQRLWLKKNCLTIEK